MIWATDPSGKTDVVVNTHNNINDLFSHLWESFMREAGFNWCHERKSVEILDFIIEENNLLPAFKEHGLTDIDIKFIKVYFYLLIFSL